MPAQWTADIIGQLHLHGISQVRLAAAMGYTPEYVSSVLRGHRAPKGAEQRFRAALEELTRRPHRKEDPQHGKAEVCEAESPAV